jgi:hypothetical protein
MSVDEDYDPQYLLAEVEEQFDTERPEHARDEEDYIEEIKEEAYRRWMKDDWSNESPEHIAEMLNSPSVPELWPERRLQDMSTGKGGAISEETLLALKGQLRSLGVGKTGGRILTRKYGKQAQPPEKGRQTHFGIVDLPPKQTKGPLHLAPKTGPAGKQGPYVPSPERPLAERLLAPPIHIASKGKESGPFHLARDFERERLKISKGGERGRERAPPRKEAGRLSLAGSGPSKQPSRPKEVSKPPVEDDPSKDPAVLAYIQRARDVIENKTASRETGSEELLLAAIVEKYHNHRDPNAVYKFTREQLANEKYMKTIRPSLREAQPPGMIHLAGSGRGRTSESGRERAPPRKEAGRLSLTNREKERRPKEREKR